MFLPSVYFFLLGTLLESQMRVGEASLGSNNVIVMLISLVLGSHLKGFWEEAKASRKVMVEQLTLAPFTFFSGLKGNDF